MSRVTTHNVTLSRNARHDLEELLNHRKWKLRFKYGGNENDNINPCIRVIDNSQIKNPLQSYEYNGKTIQFGGKSIRAYQCSYIVNNPITPPRNRTISHICGRPFQSYEYSVSWSACIEPTHLTLETIQENNTRKRCHLFIRNYALKLINPHDWDKDETQVFYVSDVPQNEKIRIAKEFIKGKTSDMTALKDYKCNCSKKCFITYGNRQYQNMENE